LRSKSSTTASIVAAPSPNTNEPMRSRTRPPSSASFASTSLGKPCAVTRTLICGNAARNESRPSSGATAPFIISSSPDSLAPKVWKLRLR